MSESQSQPSEGGWAIPVYANGHNRTKRLEIHRKTDQFVVFYCLVFIYWANPRRSEIKLSPSRRRGHQIVFREYFIPSNIYS